MRTLLVITALLALPSASHADCAPPAPLAPQIVTPRGTALDGGGGFLVAELIGRPRIAGKPDKAPTFKVKKLSAKRKTLAPGLEVYLVEPKDQTTPIEMTGGDGPPSTVVGSKAKMPPFASPDVKRVTATLGRRGIHVQVELATAVPKGVYAIVIADAKGTPRTFFPTTAGATTIDDPHGGCQAEPEGTLPTAAGDKLSLFWVDDHGRVSASASATAVTP